MIEARLPRPTADKAAGMERAAAHRTPDERSRSADRRSTPASTVKDKSVGKEGAVQRGKRWHLAAFDLAACKLRPLLDRSTPSSRATRPALRLRTCRDAESSGSKRPLTSTTCVPPPNSTWPSSTCDRSVGRDGGAGTASFGCSSSARRSSNARPRCDGSESLVRQSGSRLTPAPGATSHSGSRHAYRRRRRRDKAAPRA